MKVGYNILRKNLKKMRKKGKQKWIFKKLYIEVKNWSLKLMSNSCTQRKPCLKFEWAWWGCQSNFLMLGPWSLRGVITCVAPSIHANHRETHGHERRKHIMGWARVDKEIEDYATSLIVLHAYLCLALEPMCLLPCKGNESMVMVW